jgi:hypothetical protein
LVEWDLANIV